MKKMLTSGLVLSMLIGVGTALADEPVTSLTTKNYVDTGLKAVYVVANRADTILADSEGNGLVKDFDNLQTTVGNSDRGLVKDVDDLQDVVGDAEGGLVKDVTELQSAVATIQGTADNDTTYTDGTGIVIDTADNNAISVAGLAATTEEANQGKKYLYQNGQLTALDIENTWDPSVLNN